MEDFLSFYKRPKGTLHLPHAMQKPGKETKNSRTHHQSEIRTVSMDHRKSGKLNLVAKSHSADPWNLKIKSLLNKNLSWPLIKPVLDHYKQIHSIDTDEPYRKALNKTGYWVYYYPEKNIWRISDR